MSRFINDSPIESPDDDRYGVTPFARSLARSIANIKTPIGTTIALHGPWGSGKSSVVNLVRRELETMGQHDLVVSEFKCWWFRGEEALALAFLQNLNAVLGAELKDKVKDLIPRLGRGLLQAGPVIGPAMAFTPAAPLATLFQGTLDFAKRFFPDGDTLESTFRKLAEVLQRQNRRFLIIIDDIDRLSPDEAIAIFRLVKSVGRLPNVIYLLVFDRTLADEAVRQKYPSEGPHFLEKIIQAGFELPAPLQSDLNSALLIAIEEICGSPAEQEIQRVMNIFYDIVVPYVTTPRHAARFQNAISITWPAIANEVSVADFIALETIRLYEPTLYHAIRENKDRVCGGSQQGNPHTRANDRFAPFLKSTDEARHETVKIAVQRLFPRLENMGYGDNFLRRWNAERRVCVEAHFDTYFRLALSDETLSSAEISKIVAGADDAETIKTAFRKAALSRRRNGTSLVPVYLDELITHARNVKEAKVGSLLRSLFEIHDEIDLGIDKDRGFGGIATTTLRYHWLIRRLTESRFTLDEKTELYLSVTQSASLGWLVDFVSSARDDYRGENVGGSDDEVLVDEASVPTLVERALHAIRAAAGDGSLLHHKDLIYILYRWRDFNDDDASEPRAWTGALLEDDDSLVILARGLTGESWSYGMGTHGLGDRVSRRSTIAQISDDTDIVDPVALRQGLERVASEGRVDEASLSAVQQFLDAWDRTKQKQRNREHA
ncbi:KAP family P-loop NTPase fold protein [Sinorhizobium meliloti]|uniref:KAP family P-loop NTPase fold protein n=1 Tax=Rhizobium meliloti TaxID=382 RepID=UPI000FDBFF3C|nr:P-loop NTPase fold protein [Sinorhizobium meliloti]RVP99660.1 NTPase KAP [Sinorhizobium meliloti]